jgi:hypothetical protein
VLLLRRGLRGCLVAAASGLLVFGILGRAPALAASAPAVQAVLLPVPAAGAGTTSSTTVVAVTPLGAMAGTTVTQSSTAGNSTAQRWLPIGPGRWIRQQLPQPTGTTYAAATGLTDLAEVGGYWRTGGAQGGDVAVRWPVTGGAGTVIGDAGSSVTAVGPDGTWGVQTNVTATISATAELVARDGTRTPINTGARYSTVISIADKHTALLSLENGVGYGSTLTPAVWRDGQLQQLPVFATPLTGRACASEILPDGTVAYSGLARVGSSYAKVVQVHHGGVPGSEVPLDLKGGSADVACEGPDTVASDGSVGGNLTLPGQTGARATIWRGTEPTQLPLQAGETSSDVVALQPGNFAVIHGQLAGGGEDLWTWRNGTVIPLAIPAGYTLKNIVDLTGLGLVVGNLQDASGNSTPAAWQIP